LDPRTDDGLYAYQRGGNPTRAQLERVLAELDGAAHGFAFATGMAATGAVFSTLEVGSEVILPASVYGGTFRFVAKSFPTRVLTFRAPALQRPLELGAGVAVPSAPKYLPGPSGLLAGAVTTADPQLAEAYALSQKAEGGVRAPLDSFRLIQAIKTLPLRLERQQDNAAQIAAFLREREDVTVVHTPGSFSEEEARLHAAQAEGPGAVLSFELAPDLDRVAFLQALRYPAYAVSLGGVESLICRPATMTHEAMTPQGRATAGISDELLRLSVGIEHIDDLLA